MTFHVAENWTPIQGLGRAAILLNQCYMAAYNFYISLSSFLSQSDFHTKHFWQYYHSYSRNIIPVTDSCEFCNVLNAVIHETVTAIKKLRILTTATACCKFHNVYDAVRLLTFYLHIVEIWVNTQSNIAGQCPRSCRPCNHVYVRIFH